VQDINTRDPYPGSEKEDGGSRSSAPCARDAEVLICSRAGSGPGQGPVLTRHSALLQFTFLIEQPHGILASLVNQVLLESSFTDEEESLVVAMIVKLAKCCGPIAA
jgi:hypothetical protein